MIHIFKAIILLFIFSFVVAITGYFYVKSYLQETIQTPQKVFIPKGSTKSAIKALQKSGIDLSDYDYQLVKLIGYPQAGWIDLGATSMKRGEFFVRLTKSKSAQSTLTLIPGETKELFFKQLGKKFDLNVTKLHTFYDKVAPYPDGVILAETYNISKGMNEKDLITYLVEKSLKEHQNIAMGLLKKYDEKEWFENYITKASIITKEAANTKEMPLVSAVIKNRLKKGMPLQMDGTLNYKLQSHQKVTAKMIKEDNSKFNTYKHKGLPPHPICSVTKDAINAAVNPSDVKYLYFVRTKKGEHTFSNTYKEHLTHIKR